MSGYFGEVLTVTPRLSVDEVLQGREPMGFTRDELIEQIGALSVQRDPSLDGSLLVPESYDPLRALTAELVALGADEARAEYDRYTTVPEREQLTISEETATTLNEKLAGKTVLVTGGTGQIGSKLMDMLAGYGPGRLVSLSRGRQANYEPTDGAEYVHCDISDEEAVTAHIKEIKPDIIFHVAAQRSPGFAETHAAHTLKTNVLGTQYLINAAIAEAAETTARTGVEKTPEIVYASTGKALRPYSPDVYAASKQTAEWLFAKAVAEGKIQASGARFTHVVDNALVLSYVNNWIESCNPVRVHDPYGEFYAQSATESAQLCLLSLLEGQPDAFNLSAITNLREPIRLLDMVMGAMIERDEIVPLYFARDKGYEEEAYPFLYEPLEMGDASPLISAYEWPVRDGKTTDEIDVISVEYAENEDFDTQLAQLEEALRDGLDIDLRAQLQEVSWARLEGKLITTPERILMRAVRRIKRMDGRRQYTEEHEQTNDVIMAAADRYSSTG